MSWQTDLAYRIVFDNGSHTIKAGNARMETPKIVIPNMIGTDRRSGSQLLGEKMNELYDEHQFLYSKAMVKGVVVNFETEIQIWEDLLDRLMVGKGDVSSFKAHSLTLTTLPCCPTKVKERLMEVAFEFFSLGGFYPLHPSNAVKHVAASKFPSSLSPKFQLLVDLGHSGCHVQPIFDGELIDYGYTKLELGGRFLTKRLRDLIAFKFLGLDNELKLLADIKEKVCFISQDFNADMTAKKGSHVLHYMLPDLEINAGGYVVETLDPTKSHAEKLSLDKERFTIPELLFHPGDFHLQQDGIAGTIVQAVKKCPEPFQEVLMENIVISGGSTLFPNFVPRLQTELRKVLKSDVTPFLFHMKDVAIEAPYIGARSLTAAPSFLQSCLTREEYNEHGDLRLALLSSYIF